MSPAALCLLAAVVLAVALQVCAIRDTRAEVRAFYRLELSALYALRAKHKRREEMTAAITLCIVAALFGAAFAFSI